MKYTAIGRQTLRRLYLVGKPFWASPLKWKALALLATVLGLLFTVAAVNVFVSSIAGKFTTAMQAKDVSAYHHYLLLYAAAMVAGSPVVVFYQYLRTKLALTWRQWLTQHLVDRYLENRAYYKLSNLPEIDNPDERISQDVETFCNSAVGLFIAWLDAFVTVCSFLGVLWLISGTLTVVALAYSLIGCLLAILIGRKLVNLQFEHTRLEADLRYTLANVRRDVESIAFYNGEKSARKVIFKRIAEAIFNLELMMVTQRNLTFFTVNFNYMVALIPAAIIAPLYFAGTMEFGDITKAAIAFGQVLAGMTLLVGQFTGITAFLANINRLGSFVETLDELQAHCQKPESGQGQDSAQLTEVRMVEGSNLSIKQLCVDVPGTGRRLLRNLDLEVGSGESVIIMGPSGSGKSSLLRAIAGLWKSGSGTVSCPPRSSLMFLPQRPFVPKSTLKEAVCYPRVDTCETDDEMQRAFELVNLQGLVERAGGLKSREAREVEHEWRDILSLGEQQRLTIARLILARPRFVFLDEATSALDSENERRIYELLKKLGTTIISVGHRESLIQHHQKVLELKGDGSWRLYSSNENPDPDEGKTTCSDADTPGSN
ncbi:MAG: ABC transporter ATP-binding protein/permease [Candidatus Obscuribacter sp.]|nr:ABC transporter ATP-binding protein/permease [Candidatus Obscuribacter sp.]